MDVRQKIANRLANAKLAMASLSLQNKDEIKQLEAEKEQVGKKMEELSAQLEEMKKMGGADTGDLVEIEKIERLVKDRQLKLAMIEERLATHKLNLVDLGTNGK